MRIRTAGVVDRHVHLGLVESAALRGTAVVEVHDLGWSPTAAASWRVGAAPVVRAAGPFLTPPGGYPGDREWAPEDAVREIGDAGEAATALEDAQDFDLVKVVLHAGFPPFEDDVLAMLVDGAHDRGFRVVAHVEGAGQAARALAFGVDALAHVPWTERLDDRTIVGMAERCEWISTLALHEGEARRIALDNAQRFLAAGGRLRYGTDMGNGAWRPGLRREEVLALGEAGLRGEALVTALTDGATAQVAGEGPLPEDPADLADWFLAARPLTGADRDDEDALAPLRDRFLPVPEVVAYLDGNSLGRPITGTAERVAAFVRDRWGGRLIRGWDEGWMTEPERLGDDLARVVLGARPGTTVVGDSTTVLLYKAIRAAVALRPGRREVVHAAADFPTDRFLLQGIAGELGLRLVAIDTPHDGGVTPEQVQQAIGPDTAAVVLSHVAYRSAFVADVPAITTAAHAAGAVTVWDLSHSAGVLPLELDAWAVDLAVGCTYKYLNGGPGAPAFLTARPDLVPELRQPVQGWMGAAEPFAMGERYEPDPGIRRFLSGTPSILGMLPVVDMVALIEEAGLPAVRAKSVALTAAVLEFADAELTPLGVRLASPRDAERRGGHVTLDHPAFEAIVPVLQRRGVIPDFRRPDGLRIGLSPLSTSFAELEAGLVAVREELLARR